MIVISCIDIAQDDAGLHSEQYDDMGSRFLFFGRCKTFTHDLVDSFSACVTNKNGRNNRVYGRTCMRVKNNGRTNVEKKNYYQNKIYVQVTKRLKYFVNARTIKFETPTTIVPLEAYIVTK